MNNNLQQAKYEVKAAFGGEVVADDAEAQEYSLAAGDIFEVIAHRSDADKRKIAVVCKPGLSDYLELRDADVQTKCSPLTQKEFMQRDEQFGTASWNFDLYNHDDLEDDCAD